MLLFIVAGFFTVEQISTIAASIVTIAVAIQAVAPIYSLLLQVRLKKQIVQMRVTQLKNGGKIDALSNRTRSRATDDNEVEATRLQELPSSNVAGHGDESAAAPERGRHGTHGPL
jgi:hypothetical protein